MTSISTWISITLAQIFFLVSWLNVAILPWNLVTTKNHFEMRKWVLALWLACPHYRMPDGEQGWDFAPQGCCQVRAGFECVSEPHL